MNRAEVIIQNMKNLIEAHDQAEKDGELDEIFWWEDEFGADLTDMIDCHVVFKDSLPCLIHERNIPYDLPDSASNEDKWKNRLRRDAACAECKAKWLMEEYE